MTESPDQRKSDLRTKMRAVLQAMDETYRHEASAAACSRVMAIDAFRHASTVMLYMPLATEVDLTPLAIRCFQQRQTVCVPLVDWKRRDMEPVEVSSFDDDVMDVDEHGIRRPREGAPVPPNCVDLIVVPGLAFDAEGRRLGRGAGYYDRFLTRLRRGAMVVGLAFDGQVVGEVPVDQGDVPMHAVVTERRVAFARGSRARS